MTEIKTFSTSSGGTTHDKYKYLNKKINEYTEKNNLIIKNVQYDVRGITYIANVLFTDIPN